ncbi:MAG: hypothetical protein BMS9Abin02_0579 [Anaerolineae bacterium]|nr:MAG: hypothetical protein BMS9Abin02_0579 [Anaerolineae bacterium]
MALAIAFGLVTLLGLLLVPEVGATLTGWASLLAAVALLLGILNLLTIHSRRVLQGNFYSLVLLFGMAAVIALGITDGLGLTGNGVQTIFELVQAPLEAAMASLLAFFLIFSGYRMLQRKRSWWSLLFVVTVIIMFLARTPLPEVLSNLFTKVGDIVSEVVINPGIRGILIGVSLGIIAVSIRILTGSERPYDK